MMIAYNTVSLQNRYHQIEARQAFDQGLIGKSEFENIISHNPDNFFRTNLFLRIGLFILTIVCTSFALSFFMLFLSGSGENGFYIVAILQGLIAYFLLEIFVKEKMHYRSGVDDGLQWMAATGLASGICLLAGTSNIVTCIIFTVVSLFFAIRFINRAMALLSAAAICATIFFICYKSGGYAKAMIPFAEMLAGLGLYFLSKRLQKNERFFFYTDSLLVTEIWALALLYAAGNYYIVREMSIKLMDLTLAAGQDIPFGWFFKMATAAVPLCYLFIGIKKKNIVFLRLGMITVAASVLTLRYYHSFLPLEAALSIAGATLIVIAWLLIQKLQNASEGFVFNNPKKQVNDLLVQAPVLATAGATTSATTATTDSNHTTFGGGSFGGAGAGNEY